MSAPAPACNGKAITLCARKGDDLEPPLHANISNMIHKFGLITGEDQIERGEKEGKENNESRLLNLAFFSYFFFFFLSSSSGILGDTMNSDDFSHLGPPPQSPPLFFLYR